MFTIYLKSLLELPLFESKYLEKQNVSYYYHLTTVLSYALQSFIAGFFLLIHAFIPDYFIHTGAQLINILNSELENKYSEFPPIKLHERYEDNYVTQIKT